MDNGLFPTKCTEKNRELKNKETELNIQPFSFPPAHNICLRLLLPGSRMNISIDNNLSNTGSKSNTSFIPLINNYLLKIKEQ